MHARVLTLVFTDLADSTALKSVHGDDAMDALLTRHREHVARLAEECAGRIIDWAGDGCFLTFETSSAGVLFALRLQHAHYEEHELPGVRIGVHLGEVTEKPGPNDTIQVKGLAVDVAARIQGLAKPGQVLMSSAVYNSAKQRMGVEAMGMPLLWQLHGTYALKGFDAPLDIAEAGFQGFAPLEAPRAGDKARLIRKARRQKETFKDPSPHRLPAWGVAVIVLLAVAVGYLLWAQLNTPAPTASAGPAITSLAVLPLDNLMNDPEQDYFVDGMTEAITAELSKISSLKVISRTSAMQYRGADKSMPEIAKELGVAGLVEGSVLRDGDDVRITVQLIDGLEDRHLWSESYTNTLTSVLKLQAEVALAIADEIRATVDPDERQRIAEKDNVKPEALDAYLRGLALLRSQDEEDIKRAIKEFQSAIDADDRFAAAYAHLSDAYGSLAAWEFEDAGTHYSLAGEYARKAIELDPNSAVAHDALAKMYLFTGPDWAGATREMELSLSLDSNSAQGHHLYGAILHWMGRDKEARAEYERGLELEPDSVFLRRELAIQSFHEGDSARAIREFEEVLRDAPEFHPALDAYISCLVNADRNEEALAVAEKLASLRDYDVYSTDRLTIPLVRLGLLDRAKSLVDGHAEANATSWLYYYAALGDVERVLEIVRLRFEEGIPIVWLAVDFEFNFLRDDDRYWEFLEEYKFPLLPADHPVYPQQQRYLARKEAKRMLAEQGLDGAPRIESLAVLPLDNYSNEPDQEYFVDGMTDALTAELSKVASLKVIARTSAMRYKETDLSIREIAKELGVDALIEGSVYRSGDDVRITAQLVRGETEGHIWGESYEETIENVISLQGRMAVAIVEEVRAAVTPEEERRITFADSTSPEAYDAYLRAQHALQSRNREAFESAKAHLETSLSHDSEFAPAYAGLAQVYALQVGYGMGDRRSLLALSRESARKALAIDPENADAHAALGVSNSAVSTEPSNWREAEKHYLEAIRLQPGLAIAHAWLGMLYTEIGRLDQGLKYHERSVELDPLGAVPRTLLAENLIYRRQYERAESILNSVLEDDPNSLLAVNHLQQLYSGRGYTEADVARSQILLDGLGIDGFLGLNYSLLAARARLGQTDDARAAVAELDVGDAGFQFTVPVADIWFALGNREKGFQWLGMDTDARGYWPFLRNGPAWDSIRDDDRYWVLMEELGFPPFPPEHPLYEIEQEWLVRRKAEDLIRERGLVPAETAN